MMNASAGHPIRVLLIEDDPSTARTMRRILAETSVSRFEVEWVERLGSGIERLSEGGVDVVLLDLMLPDSRGLESLTRIQGLRSMTAVVVVSGLDDESLAVEAVYQGAQDYLLKGQFHDQLLVRALRSAVERNRSQRRQAAQYAVTRILAESATLEDAAIPALEALGSKLAWEVGNLWLVDRQDKALRCSGTWHAPGVAAGPLDELNMRGTFPPGFGLPGRVWAKGEPVWVSDVTGDDRYPRAAAMLSSGLRGAFGFPILLGKDVLGVIEFFSRESRAPDADLIAMLSSVGGQVGQFVGRKRLESELVERARLGALFAELGSSLISGGPMPAVLQRCVEGLVQYVGAAFACIWIVGEPNRTLHLRATAGKPTAEGGPSPRVLLDGPGVGRIAREKRPFSTGEMGDDPRVQDRAWAIAEGLRSFVGYPLIVDGRVCGVMAVYARQPLTPAALQALLPMADGVAQYIERKRTEEALRHSEERLRVLFEQMPGVLWTTDTDLHFTSSWGTGLERLNLLPAQSLGQSLAAYFGTDDPDFLPIAAHRQALAGEPVSYEFHWMGMTFQCHVESLADREGRTIGCIGVALDVTRYWEVEKALNETKLEMHLAGQIQRGFFPKAAPPIPGFDIAGASLPALTAGGDYYDYIPFADGLMGIVIGDVSGHGLGPALLMASLRAHLHAIAATTTDVGLILTRLNKAFYRDACGERFVTIVLARLDPVTRSLVYSSAGHSTGYVLDRSGAVKTRVESDGLPLGIETDSVFTTAQPITLEPGDVVLLLTDGVEDAAGRDGTIFGAGNAIDVVHAHVDEPARVIVERLHLAVSHCAEGMPQRDDITTVVIKVH